MPRLHARDPQRAAIGVAVSIALKGRRASASEEACLVEASGVRVRAWVPVGVREVVLGAKRFALEFTGTPTHLPTFYEVKFYEVKS